MSRSAIEFSGLHVATPFSYFVCHHEAKPTIKAARCEPNGRYCLAYSQNGFVTPKASSPAEHWATGLPDGLLVQARGHALKRFDGPEIPVLVEKVLAEQGGLNWTALHVWQRDPVEVDWHGFVPDYSVSSQEAATAVIPALKRRNDVRSGKINIEAPPGPEDS